MFPPKWKGNAFTSIYFAMSPVKVTHGNLPIVLAMPHTSCYVPNAILETFTDSAKQLVDTDWNIHQLYDELLPNATTVRAMFHRYVIDANRSSEDSPLYAENTSTALCPLTTFEGDALYLPGCEPDKNEIGRRLERYYVPYHNELKETLYRVQAKYGFAMLFDCHSVRSTLPYLDSSNFADFNIGTNNGTSCALTVQNTVLGICRRSPDYTVVLNGKFKGGFTTQHYGNPSAGIHAIQMELAQSTYMQESSPWTYDVVKAERISIILARALNALRLLAKKLKQDLR